jgi:cell division protein FtsI (penicillin-binding protein 3)
MYSQKFKPQAAQPLHKIRNRFIVVVVGCLLAFALLTARAFELHFTDNAKLSNLASRQYHRKVVVAPKRGNILDSHGETLAIDVRVDSVYATPHLIANPAELAGPLTKVLHLSEDKILARLSQKDKKFVWIKRRLTQEESVELAKLGLQGIGTLPEYKRFYPNGDLAANLIGAVGYDATSLAGLEMTFDDTLKSDSPPLLVEQDAKGRSYSPYALIGLERPNQIVLSLDKNIQHIAQRELQKAVDQAKAKAGTALVLEVATGSLLALAVTPSFDPNHYADFPQENWRIRAATDLFEPGSTFKAFTAASALELGKIKMSDKIHCENGAMSIGKFTINDHHGYGLLSLPEIIKYSSNICSYKIAQRMGRESFIGKIREFGFGQKTAIPIPGEQPGFLASAKSVGAVQLGTIGFGQGISVTPLQLLMAYGAIANGGKLMKPLLVKEIQDADGKPLQKFEPEVLREVISPEVARQTLELLSGVVEKGGTGTKAALEGYSVAGKTGTAQKVVEGSKGYAKNKYVASFVGVAPVKNPELVVLVSIDEPKGAYYGGQVSAPVFRSITEQTLAYLKVTPDKEKSDTAPVLLAKKTGTKTEKKSPEKKTKEIPSKEKENDSSVADAKSSTPDLTGLPVREVLRRAQAENLEVKINGSGICTQQQPMPGRPGGQDAPIEMECQPPI